jgi:hypothetical protein
MGRDQHGGVLEVDQHPLGVVHHQEAESLGAQGAQSFQRDQSCDVDDERSASTAMPHDPGTVLHSHPPGRN